MNSNPCSSFFRITKYGTLVPSADVAKCCSTVSPSASNMAGLDFRGVASASGETRSDTSDTSSRVSGTR